MNLTGPLLIVIGLFSIAGGLLDWDWFMRSRRARWLVRTLGRAGARAFYMLLGITVIVFGLMIASGTMSGG